MNRHWYMLQVYRQPAEEARKAIEQNLNDDGRNKIESIRIPPGLNEEHSHVGYLLIKADLTEKLQRDIEASVQNGVFYGQRGRNGIDLTRFPEYEVERLLNKVRDDSRYTPPFAVGDQIKVIDGPFTGFTGVVSAVTEEKNRITAKVSIFGRETPVELTYLQIEPV